MDKVPQPLSRCLSDKLADLLSIAPVNRPALERRISGIIFGYSCDGLIQAWAAHPKLKKAQITKLAKGLKTALDALISLPPEYNIAIATLGGRDTNSGFIDTRQLAIDLALLELGVARFLIAFEPPTGRPTNYALEQAIRILLPLVRDELACEVTIRFNKATGGPPEPNSNGARAIVAILESVPAPPTQTAILNMISRVEHDPDGEAKYPGEAAMRTHFDELDASLLPGREKGW